VEHDTSKDAQQRVFQQQPYQRASELANEKIEELTQILWTSNSVIIPNNNGISHNSRRVPPPIRPRLASTNPTSSTVAINQSGGGDNMLYAMGDRDNDDVGGDSKESTVRDIKKSMDGGKMLSTQNAKRICRHYWPELQTRYCMRHIRKFLANKVGDPRAAQILSRCPKARRREAGSSSCPSCTQEAEKGESMTK